MQKYIGSIDQGTTSTRFIIFDQDANIKACVQKEHRQYHENEGWVEHDAIEIWQNTVFCINRAMQEANLTASDIAAIGITNQRESTVIWNKITHEPIYRVIVWSDTRTSPFCNELSRRADGQIIRRYTGLQISPYFSASKIKWIIDNVPGAKAQAEAGELNFGTIDSWLLYKLTGHSVHLTDATNASRTLLMDIRTLQWDKRCIETFSLNYPNLLPTICPSNHKFGQVSCFELSSSLANVPITGILGDQQASLFGQTCFECGQGKCTYGTGAFVLVNTGSESLTCSGLVTTIAYQMTGKSVCYAVEGSIGSTGSVIQWLRDDVQIIDSADQTSEIALSVPDNGGVYFVPAFSGLFSPYWKMDARGLISGLTRHATRKHLVRAALEATAFQVKDVIDALVSEQSIRLKDLRVDGGMTLNQFLMQFQANLLECDIMSSKTSEATALGVAYMAGLSVGYWTDLNQLKTLWVMKRRWRCEIDDGERKDIVRTWRKAVRKSIGWSSEESESASTSTTSASSAPLARQLSIRGSSMLMRRPSLQAFEDNDPHAFRTWGEYLRSILLPIILAGAIGYIAGERKYKLWW